MSRRMAMAVEIEIIWPPVSTTKYAGCVWFSRPRTMGKRTVRSGSVTSASDAGSDRANVTYSRA